MLEGRAADSVAADRTDRGVEFPGPEGLFYLSRHLARLNEGGRALDLLERVVDSGYCCFPTMARDPWLDTLRKKAAFGKLLRQSELLHASAVAAFEQAGGRAVFGAAPAAAH